MSEYGCILKGVFYLPFPLPVFILLPYSKIISASPLNSPLVFDASAVGPISVLRLSLTSSPHGKCSFFFSMLSTSHKVLIYICVPSLD